MKGYLTIALIFILHVVRAQTSFVLKPYASSSWAPRSQTINIVRLSDRGVSSDADISFGSATFGSNQDSAIQAILNEASGSSPLYLIWDCKVGTLGFRLKSNTYIFALPNCGAILYDSANNFIFKNNGWDSGLNNIVDSNITVQGGIWNGNGWRGGVGKQLHSSSSKGMITGMCFIGVKNLSLLDQTLFNTRTYGLLFLTVENVYIDHFNIDDGNSAGINQDGIVFAGYAQNINLSNLRIKNGDDKIAFAPNATGGSIGTEHHEPYTGIKGDQTNIYINNVFFDSLGKGLAFYLTGDKVVKNIYASNISGRCFTNWMCAFNQDFLTGYTIATGSNASYGFHFKNINVEILGKYGYDNSGYPLACLGASINDVTFDDVTRLDQSYAVPTIGTLKFGATAISFKNISINNLKCITSSPSANNQINISSATVNNLRVSNCNIDFTSSLQTASFINVTSGSTVTSVNVVGNNVAYLKYVYNNAGTTTNAIITNINHTGQGGSDPTVNTSGTFTKLIMNGWNGVVATSGTIGTTSNGNAF